MDQPPRQRRGRGRRRPSSAPRPTQAPAQPTPPAGKQPGQQRRGGERRPERPRVDRGPRAPRRGRPRAPRPAGERVGTPALILLDRREGDPDLTGKPALFEGYFDPETGERRRPGNGLPRLRVGNDRIWGFECWWRADPEAAGVKPEDHEELETSKKLLRGLLRDARRGMRPR